MRRRDRASAFVTAVTVLVPASSWAQAVSPADTDAELPRAGVAADVESTSAEAPRDTAGHAPSGMNGATSAPPPAGGDAAGISQAARSGATLRMGVRFPTRYYFRGIVREFDPDFTVQPYLEGGTRLELDEGPLEGAFVELFVGMWSSFNTGSAGSDAPAPLFGSDDPAAWFEARLYGGAMLGASGFTLAPRFTAYTSPSGRFDTFHEVSVALSYDDRALFASVAAGRFFGFAPSALFALEVNGSVNDSEGAYLQLGIAPAFLLVDEDSLSLTGRIPIEVGLSVSDYYDERPGVLLDRVPDKRFGFLSAGALLSLGLDFIPAGHGAWSVDLEAELWVLGPNTEWVDRDGDLRDADLVVTAGLSSRY